MAQRDYVRRAQSPNTRRKKSSSRKKTQRPAVSPVMVAVAAAVVVTFIGALYFITHRKAEEAEVLPSHKVTGNGLPPKPEERWRYIKELENRQPSVLTPTEPTAGGETLNHQQLTNEQLELLAQLKADGKRPTTQLPEVPWNGLPSVSQVKQPPLQAQQAYQQPVRPAQTQVYQQPVKSAQTQAYQQPARPAASQPSRTTSTQTPEPARTTRHDTPAAPITREPETVKQTPAAQDKKEEKRWMVQCGSFRNSDQAETVRAQLAFEGFSSHITVNSGWNRVVIGPLKGRSNADSTLSRLKQSGHGNCFTLAFGG